MEPEGFSGFIDREATLRAVTLYSCGSAHYSQRTLCGIFLGFKKIASGNGARRDWHDEALSQAVQLEELAGLKGVIVE